MLYNVNFFGRIASILIACHIINFADSTIGMGK